MTSQTPTATSQTTTATSPAVAAVVVLAAGQGTRMRSATPKVLHRLGGRPMLGHVLAATRVLGAPHTVVVVGAGRDQVEEHLAGELADLAPGARAVVQEEQLGSGHAAAVALAALPDLEKIGFIKKKRIHVFEPDEVGDIDRLGGFDIDPGKVLFLEDHKFAFLVFIPFDDLIPRNLLAISLRNPLVVDRTQVARTQQTKPQFLATGRGVQGHRNIDETEAD